MIPCGDRFGVSLCESREKEVGEETWGDIERRRHVTSSGAAFQTKSAAIEIGLPRTCPGAQTDTGDKRRHADAARMRGVGAIPRRDLGGALGQQEPNE
ncbi:hypothetical protein SKAU_G00346740 [Synaphobranchus kaupii]|uniref:Uncharacterized protein n=1 Tax=Synaphobranchus kaupii TaxID=118154 RepID=A0A9Q1EJM7_SYNKA|nr:hypothetical protein SKAU_G00346740 [Synaphobranchus kaupii]